MIFDVNDLAAIQVGLASPDAIRNWSHGEVQNSETINYRSHKPEFGGLFCEQIFGPVKDYECACGKYKKMRYQGTTCEKCHVEVTSKEWRRERFGHINLVSPCSHIWYLKGVPSRMSLVLEMSPKDLEEVIYFAAHVVLNPGTSNVLKYKDFLDEKAGRHLFTEAIKDFMGDIPEGSNDEAKANEYIAALANENETFDYYSISNFIRKYTGAEFGEGASAVKRLLHEVDLDKEFERISEKMKSTTGNQQTKLKLAKRLEVIQAFRDSNQKPEWMILDAIPVIPPELRPMLQLDGGRFTDSDINDLYRRVIIRNNRLKKLIENNSPSVILVNERRMLQEAVDALIDNGKRGKPVLGKNGRALKSLSSGLKGKQGRFRQNLLGKRVDYSGRSVIAVGPSLKMYQCGLPREMAVQLLRPFIAAILLRRGVVSAHKQADKLIDSYDPKVYDIIEEIISQHPVLLNRAPTLHRLSVQAFQPVLVDGHAIRLHPLVCPGFNADFDGDQMAVHVPLGKAAQEEALDYMLASNNILGPKDGKAIVVPSQDMVLGNYYLTQEESRADFLARAKDLRKVKVYNDEEKLTNEEAALKNEHFATLEGKIFGSVRSVIECYETGNISLHTRILIPAKSVHKTFGDDLNEFALPASVENKYLITTVGKIIFNEIFPDDFVFINANHPNKFTKEQIESWFVSPKDVDAFHDELEAAIKGKSDEDAISYIENRFFKDENGVWNDNHYKDAEFDILAKEALALHKDDDALAEYICLKPLASAINKDDIGSIIDMVFHKYDMKDVYETEIGPSKTSAILDKIKDQGFKYSTISSVTVALSDIKDIANKEIYVTEGQKKVDRINAAYEKGYTTDEERYKAVIGVWKQVTDDVAKEVQGYMVKDRRNPLVIMKDSGARGSIDNFKQLIGMKGLVSNPKNEEIERPIISSYRTGMKVSEFFINTHGARKGGADTALKTADSGYLTRRLVDVSQDVVVREEDCHCDRGYKVSEIVKVSNNGNSTSKRVISTLKDRILGRYSMHDIVDPTTGEVLVPGNTLILEPEADKIEKAGIKEVEIRSLFTCQTKNGVCQHCYGLNTATGHLVKIGDAVGIMAAQSIGEPGTQLTMRVFHTGGMAGEDITSGLPRVAELVEARNPKGQAIISKFEGDVTELKEFDDGSAKVKIVASSKKEGEEPESLEYDIPRNNRLHVHKGDHVSAGGLITEGSKRLQDLLEYTDPVEVEKYLTQEIKQVYASQGIGLNDKHLEIIIRKMLRKMYIVDSGDTNLLPGIRVDVDRFTEENGKALMEGKRPAIGKPLILGITKAALETDSFLSAASFQQTTTVLTDAAIKAKRDPLHGLKENVITGKLIPAGTGLLSEEDENEKLADFEVLDKMKEVKSQYIEAHDRQEN